MNNSALSFNALPPIDLPFRFFITAPLFIIASAFIVLFSGESLWLTRWHPNMLALTHGFTLGFLTMVMMGALLQLLPVIGGVGIAKPRFIAGFSHLLYSFGVMSLVLAFIYNNTWLTVLALFFLGCGLTLYITAIAWILSKKLSQGDSIIGFRLAIFSLVFLVILGFALLVAKQGYTLDILRVGKHLTNVHALWGLAGWAGLLIIAVSFQVLPMFYVAPRFPNVISRFISVVIFLVLVLFVLTPELAMPLLFISYGLFSLSLLDVIDKRKRKVPDTSIRYWQLAAFSLLALNVLYFLPASYYQGVEHQALIVMPSKAILLTSVFIYFFLVSIIQGMLLKILPFLSYTHLQQRCLLDFSAMKFIPHMHDFLAKKHAEWLYYGHLLTGFSLVVVLFNPSFYYVFALLLLGEFSWLLFLMLRCMSIYFSVDKKINLSSSN
jgi:hypothetical protein